MMIALWTCLTLVHASTPVALNLFESPAGDHAFVVTKDRHELGLLDVRDGKVLEVPVREGYQNYRGWQVDLRLGDGRRVLVPPDAHRARPGDHRQAYLIEPRRAPERLLIRAVSAEALARWGLTDRVSLAEPESATRPEPRVPGGAAMVIVTPPDEAPAFDGRLERAAAAAGAFVLNPRDLTFSIRLVITPGDAADRVVTASVKAGARSALLVNSAAADDLFVAFLGHLGAENGLRSVRAGLDHLAQILKTVRQRLPRGRGAFARRLRTNTTEWSALSVGERLTSARNARRLNAFYDSTVATIERTYRNVLAELRRLRTEPADRLVLLAGAAVGAPGFDLMSDEAWFSWFDEQIRHLADVPRFRTFEERRELGWFVDRPNVSLDPLRVTLQLIDADAPGAFVDFDQDLAAAPAWPLRGLGMGERRAEAMRRRVLALIVDADARVARLMDDLLRDVVFEALVPLDATAEETARLRHAFTHGTPGSEFWPRLLEIEARERLDGSAPLHTFVASLARPPEVFETDPRFEAAAFQLNAAEILIDLLDTADSSFKTRGTYLTALNAAIRLTRERPRSAAVHEKQIELAAAVQRRMVIHVSKAADRCMNDLWP